MKKDAEPSAPEIEAIKTHLDNLLGIDVRKPGAAASLPAVIRITETLEPAGGKDFPVFPPSYAGEGNNAPPVYDLNGIEWGEVLREKSARDGTKRITRYIKRARHCTMDSPQSHGNRTEIAFRDDPELRDLVPQAEAKIPRKEEFANQSRAHLLALPHRVADFRVRASNQKTKAATAIKAFANGDALPLLELMPTSILFGFWDSRSEGYQHKHARILLTRIDAFDVVPCEKRSLYTGPYSKDECATVVLDNSNLAEQLAGYDAKATDEEDEKVKAGNDAKKWADKMAERGFSNALSSGLGGIFAERIERLALISLTDIAAIFCLKKPTAQEADDAKLEMTKAEPDNNLTNAARRYLLALALLAENYPRSLGSYRLRSGCELLPTKKEISVLGSGSDTESAKALRALCGNRALLIAVAKEAFNALQLPKTLPVFECSKESLKGELEQGAKHNHRNGSRSNPKRAAKANAASGESAAEGDTGSTGQAN
jgi:CRISPR-associated protein Csb1